MVTKNFLIFVTFLFYVSCSTIDHSDQRILMRKVASDAPMDDVVIDVEEEALSVSGTVRVYGKRHGYNEFNFPLYNLESPYYKSVPYYIILNSQDVSCIHSSNIKKVSDDMNYFKISDYSYGDYLKCKYTGKGENYFNFSYRIPKMKPFEVSEANYMKGFYPDIVSNMELSLARIYKKLVPPDGSKPERLYYRDRELLMKYVPDIAFIEFDPRKKEIQFTTKLEDQDLFQLVNIQGEMAHPKHGKFDYTGYENDDFFKYGNAGSKYLRPEKVKPFALFCERDGKVYDFEYTNELTLSEPGEVKCSINSRHQGFLGLRTVKGKVKAEIKIMRIQKAIKNLPKYYLDNAKKNITDHIEKMNKSNMKKFEKGVQSQIDQHKKDIVDMLVVDKSFPYNVKVKAATKVVHLYNKPYIRYETTNGVDVSYLSYRVFSKKQFIDEHGSEFTSSDVLLGALHTNMVVRDSSKLANYTLEYKVNPGDYFVHFDWMFEKYLDNEKEVIDFKFYKGTVDRFNKKAKHSPKFSDMQEIELSRFGLYLCGEVVPYTTGNNTYEKLIMKKLKARYDLFEGGNVNSFRTMFSDKFYYEKYDLEDPIEITTYVQYSDRFLTGDLCFYISAEDFANQSYENSVLLKNI